MQLSESLIAQFQQAHLEEFGLAISSEAAETELLSLAELVEITRHTHDPINEDKTNGEVYGTRPKL